MLLYERNRVSDWVLPARSGSVKCGRPSQAQRGPGTSDWRENARATSGILPFEETGRKTGVRFNQKATYRDLNLAGYNPIVTSEVKMDALEITGVYHKLWQIEESFRVMKAIWMQGRFLSSFRILLPATFSFAICQSCS